MQKWRECLELWPLCSLTRLVPQQRPLRSAPGTTAKWDWRQSCALRERTDVTDVSQRAGLTRSVASSIEFHEELLTLASLPDKARGYLRRAVKTGVSENFPPL